MKSRVTLTIDPKVARRAKKVARSRNTSVSGLVEDLLRTVQIPGGEPTGSFAARWAGRFIVADSASDDLRMKVLKTRYGLDAS